jgi:hypothetical protein
LQSGVIVKFPWVEAALISIDNEIRRVRYPIEFFKRRQQSRAMLGRECAPYQTVGESPKHLV